MSHLKQLSDSKCFGGRQQVYEHESKELGCKMKFTLFLPSAIQETGIKLPVIYMLGGSNSCEQDMCTKSGFQRYAERYKLIVVGPDTSPRDCNVPGEKDSKYLGEGVGYYIDAIREPWRKNYRMYSYVTKELRELIETNFSQADPQRVGISGHSMGGHGALVLFFKNPHIYKAVSAFAPVANPVNSPWATHILKHYIGEEHRDVWSAHDATELVKVQPRRDVRILIDQGTDDHHLKKDLLPENFVKACEEVGQPLDYHEHPGYDHGYLFVSTFMEKHLKHLARSLGVPVDD